MNLSGDSSKAQRILNFSQTGLTIFHQSYRSLSATYSSCLIDANSSEITCYRRRSISICTKAIGPDDIPNKLRKDFSFELAPVIKDIYNQSLKRHMYKLF